MMNLLLEMRGASGEERSIRPPDTPAAAYVGRRSAAKEELDDAALIRAPENESASGVIVDMYYGGTIELLEVLLEDPMSAEAE
jgi:hypothetical protein